MGAVGAVVAIGSAVVGAVGSSKARKQQQKAAEAQAELNRIQMEKEMNEFKAEKLAMDEEIIAASYAQGIQNSSLQEQALVSLQTQYDTEMDYMEEVADLGGTITAAENKASEIAANTKLIQGVFNIAGGFF